MKQFVRDGSFVVVPSEREPPNVVARIRRVQSLTVCVSVPKGCENIQSFIVTLCSMKCISTAAESLLWGTNTNKYQMVAVMSFNYVLTLPGCVWFFFKRMN